MTKLDKFIEQLKNIFGSRLKSVFVYGAKAGEKADNLLQDVDLMVLVTDLRGEDIKNVLNRRENGWARVVFFAAKGMHCLFLWEKKSGTTHLMCMRWNTVI